MAFDDLERSNYDGMPLALYEFRADSVTWNFASTEDDVVYGGKTYKGIPISDTGFTLSGDAQESEVRVTLPSSEPFALLYRGTPLSEKVWLTIRRKHRNADDAPVYWIGSVVSTKEVSMVATEVVCQILTASFNRRGGLRLSWGRQCPHALYDMNCRADKTEFAASVQIDSLTGSTVTAAALAGFDDDYFSYGFFEWESSIGLIERRGVEIHEGDHFTVLGSTDGLDVDGWITLYPGCNRTTSHCNGKFNNLSNYGGIPHLPGRSPFDGNQVW